MFNGSRLADDATYDIDSELPSNNLFRQIVFILLVCFCRCRIVFINITL